MAVILNLHGCGEKLQKNASKTNNKDYVMKGLQLKLINLFLASLSLLALITTGLF